MCCVFLSSHCGFFMLMDEKKHPTQWISNRNGEKMLRINDASIAFLLDEEKHGTKQYREN